MQLDTLVATSAAVAATRSRLKKVGLLSDCLRQLDATETRPGVCYLMGVLPQGRIGLGHAGMNGIRVEPAQTAVLSIHDTDRLFDRLAAVQGAGAQARRKTLLVELLQRADGPSQDFLFRLILGELRQGALEGLMTEAVARATGQPLAAVRRAVMLGGDTAAVAEAWPDIEGVVINLGH